MKMKTAIAGVRLPVLRSGNRRLDVCAQTVPPAAQAVAAPLAKSAVPAGMGGFTIVEMVLVAGIFGLLATWMVSSQIFGMRIYTLAATKLVATEGARTVTTALRNQIRQANEVYIGNCSSDWSSYTDITDGQTNQGNAIEIYPTTNAVPYMICYLDTTTSTNRLMLYTCTDSNSPGTLSDLCDYITNKMVFDAEDGYGNILTNDQDNRVIGITMQFSQWEYPIASVGTTNFNHFDFYQLRTRATRRSID